MAIFSSLPDAAQEPGLPYLDGNWAPVHDELVSDELTVRGRLPAELSGMFLRNGPNPHFPPLDQHHWFDGDGMVHAVRLHDGRATYSNRYVQTNGLALERQAGRALWTGIMNPPQRDVPVQSCFIRAKKNVANTALVWHAGRLLALWDTGEPYALRASDLHTEGPYTFGGSLAFPITSHVKRDPFTGELILLGSTRKQPASLWHGVVSREGDLGPTTQIALPQAVWIHDFAITPRYTVVLDLPLTLSPARAMAGDSPYYFERELPGRLGVLPRYGEGSSVRWFELPAFFISHCLNAYEEGDEVVLLGCRTDSVDLGLSQVRGGPLYQIPPRLHEWRLDLRTGVVRDGELDDLPVEFPKVSPLLIGRKTRYGYAARMVPRRLYLMDGLVKFDLRDRTSRVHEFGAGCYGGDLEFVPRPGATAEDDGWVLSLVHDERQGHSELVVMDAQDITAPPVARVLMPRRIPYGVHSTWIPGDELGSP